MSLQSLRNRSWLHTALAVLVLCFALGSIATAGHRHEQNDVVCKYCTAFGSMADASPPEVVAVAAQLVAEVVAAPRTGFIATRSASVAQARAPPVSC